MLMQKMIYLLKMQIKSILLPTTVENKREIKKPPEKEASELV
jgi:hypothetical protein